jgi:hypothetical protein
MVDNDVPVPAPTPANDKASLGEPIDCDARRRLRAGSRKSIDSDKGRFGVGFLHIWTAEANGRRVRRKKEKTLVPASMPKHEAQSKLADYIEEFTGRVTKQGTAIATFAELWKAFCAVRSGRWSKKTREDLRGIFAKHVLPSLENQPPREVRLTLPQLLLNRIAEAGYGATAVGRVRTYIKAGFEYAVDEDLVEKNPARKLVMPNIRKKSCGCFLTVDELRAILAS